MITATTRLNGGEASIGICPSSAYSWLEPLLPSSLPVHNSGSPSGQLSVAFPLLHMRPSLQINMVVLFHDFIFPNFFKILPGWHTQFVIPRYKSLCHKIVDYGLYTAILAI